MLYYPYKTKKTAEKIFILYFLKVFYKKIDMYCQNTI